MSTQSKTVSRKSQIGKNYKYYLKRYEKTLYLIPSLLLLIVGWQLIIVLMDPPYYILPSPSEVWNALKGGTLVEFTNRGSYLLHLSETLKGTFAGFIVGSASGIFLGIVISEIAFVERLVLPYVVGLQSMPKIALAPLVVVWFGFGSTSKVAMAALVTFFPLVINTIAGLKSVDRERIELMRSLSASRWQTFKMVKFPSAMPFIVAALDMAIIYALLGAIVAEFVGAQRGIGVQILVLGSVGDIGGVYACLLILALTGMILHSAFQIIEKRLLFWVQREEVVAAGV